MKTPGSSNIAGSGQSSPTSPPSRWSIPYFLRRAFLVSGVLFVGASAEGQSPVELKFFEDKIRPLLVEQCYDCHSAKSEKLKGQFLADSRVGIRRGGESRMPGVVPGDVESSRLIAAVRWKDPDLQMPPKKALSEAQVRDLEAWVKMGAPDPREEVAVKGGRKTLSREEARNYWAFRPLKSPALPPLKPLVVAAASGVFFQKGRDWSFRLVIWSFWAKSTHF